MPKLVIPNYSQGIDQGSGVAVANRIANAVGSINNPTVQTGAIQQQGAAINARISNEFAQRASAAIDNTIGSQALSKAQERASQQINARMAQTTNEDGTPNFDSLQSDIKKITDDVKNDVGKYLIARPDVLNGFNQAYNQYAFNQQSAAAAQARTQQLDYIKAGTLDALNTFKNNAVNATSEADVINTLTSAEGTLNKAVAAGAMTATQAEQMKISFNREIRIGRINNVIEANPDAALKLLKTNPEGLDAGDKIQLTHRANAAIEDRQRIIERAQRERDAQVAAQQSALVTQLQIDMLDGKAGRKEIEGARAIIGEDNYLRLRTKLASQDRGQADAAQLRSEIDSKLSSSGDLSDFSTKQINDHFDDSVQRLGGNISLAQKAALASNYKYPIKSLERQVGWGLTDGDSNQAKEALQAYKYSIANNPANVREMDTKAQAIAASVDSLTSNTSVPFDKALSIARKSVLDTTDSVRTERLNNYKRLDETKPKNIEATVSDALGLRHWFTSNDKLAPGLTNTSESLLKEFYIQTGDINSAKKMLQHQMEGVVGKSSLSDNLITPYAPEKVLGVDSDTLRKAFDREVVANLPVKPADSSNILIFPDKLTLSNPAAPSYQVYERDQFGNLNPIMKDGQPLRWSITQSDLHPIDEAIQGRKDIISGQANLNQYAPLRKGYGRK